MVVRAIGLRSLFTILLSESGEKTLAERRLAELRGVSPREFATRGPVERPLQGASALQIELSPTVNATLGGGVVGMTESIVRARVSGNISIVGTEPLADLLYMGRR